MSKYYETRRIIGRFGAVRFPRSHELVNEMSEILDVPAEGITDMDVRLQVLDDGTWQLHYGDAQYDTDHRGYWGASIISVGMNRRDLNGVAQDLISQAQEHHAQ